MIETIYITEVGYHVSLIAALHRSKKRVQAVVTTELPFLLSKEFSFNQENDRHNMNDLAFGCSNKASAELHEAKWSKLFHQMDTELSEEEKQLVSTKLKCQTLKFVLFCICAADKFDCRLLCSI